MLGGSEKEKDKKTTDKEKEEKKDRKEVWHLFFIRCLSDRTLNLFFPLILTLCLCLEKEEGEEEIQQGEERPPVF